MKENRRKKKGLNSRMQEKVVVLFFLVILAMIAITIQIIVIYTTKGEEYSKTVLNTQVYDSKVLPYQRGSILDRNGTALAVSERVYNLIIDCKVMCDKDKKYVEETLNALQKYFPEVKMEEIRNLIAENPDSQYYKALAKLSYDDIQEFLQEQKENSSIKGIWFEQDYIRSYPYNTLASHVIGFEGLYGLEGYYNEELTGTNGRQYGYINDDLTAETVTKRATDGNNLVTTLDVNIQLIVERCIKEWNDSHLNEAREGLGSTNTAVMVVDPDNGEILAQATYPYFDLNDPRDLSVSGLYTAEEDAEMENLKDGSKSTACASLWKDFCVTNTFEPGSTMKPFTVAAALEIGAITGDEGYVCDGYEQVADRKIKCVSRSGHGALTVSDAIAKSCNDVMMQIVRKIGKTQFLRFQNIYGFGKKTGVDLPGEANTSALIHTEDSMNETELATCSFGQGFNVTMMQIASGYCSLINGGTYYQPHLVKQIQDSNGGTVENKSAVVLKETVSKETSQLIRSYLKQTVMEGTGKTALVDGYTMGGKTGTAETLPRGNRNYVVSFIGHAPADDPEVVVYVVVNEPNVEDQPHSSYAQEIAHNIFQEILPYMNIFPTEGTQETTQEPDGTEPGAEEVLPEVAEGDTEGSAEGDTEGDTAQ